jgi:hypothetical protein
VYLGNPMGRFDVAGVDRKNGRRSREVRRPRSREEMPRQKPRLSAPAQVIIYMHVTGHRVTLRTRSPQVADVPEPANPVTRDAQAL